MCDTVMYCAVQVNPDMIPQLEKAGLSFVGKDETGRRMEVRICRKPSWHGSSEFEIATNY